MLRLCKLIYLTSSLTFCCLPAFASEPIITLCGNSAQGEVLQGHATGLKSIVLNGAKQRISQEGDFIMAFDRDQGSIAPITITDANSKETTLSLKVNKTKWDVQNIKGLPQKKVTPGKAEIAAIKSERKLVRGALTGNLVTPYWQSGFIEPVSGRISGYFGGQRIMNEQKMNPHAGTDIAAPEGTNVKAAADGIVVLNTQDLFYSGNTVIIDHGHGLQTVYAHLKDSSVKKGDQVLKGGIIGHVGKTGRVTGPHLHWGASLRGTRFNPYSLLKINNNNNFCFNLATNNIE